MSNNKSSIVIPTSVDRPYQNSMYDNEPQAEPWYGDFTSSRLGSMVIHGQIKTMGKHPLNMKIPYLATVYITYMGLYRKGSTIEVDALITPAGQMRVVVGEGSEIREIVFTADNRTSECVSGNYIITSGPMQDKGKFCLNRGVRPSFF